MGGESTMPSCNRATQTNHPTNKTPIIPGCFGATFSNIDPSSPSMPNPGMAGSTSAQHGPQGLSSSGPFFPRSFINGRYIHTPGLPPSWVCEPIDEAQFGRPGGRTAFFNEMLNSRNVHTGPPGSSAARPSGTSNGDAGSRNNVFTTASQFDRLNLGVGGLNIHSGINDYTGPTGSAGPTGGAGPNGNTGLPSGNVPFMAPLGAQGLGAGGLAGNTAPNSGGLFANPPPRPSLFGGLATNRGGLFGTGLVPDKPFGGIRVGTDQAFDLGLDTIEVRAGPYDNRQSFTVHKNLICARSKTVKQLLDVDDVLDNLMWYDTAPSVAALYTQFLYFKHLPTAPVHLTAAHDEYELLIKFYILATFLQDTTAKNTAVSAISAAARDTGVLPSSVHIELLYDGTPGPCPARKMIADLYVNKATNQSMQGPPFPAEFMKELALSFVAGKTRLFGPANSGLNFEDYHEK